MLRKHLHILMLWLMKNGLKKKKLSEFGGSHIPETQWGGGGCTMDTDQVLGTHRASSEALQAPPAQLPVPGCHPGV